MKFPISWLQDFVDISDLTASQLAELLTRSGLEVEGVSNTGAMLCNIVTGRIESIEKHPNADRLQITQISDGTSIHQIVTGAQNISVGNIVPVSLPGAVLSNGLTIKQSKLRGIPSNGMLCSETELGAAETANGIWILPDDTPVGIDFVQYGLLNEFVLDISILPNRGDCQSVYGLAREIAALLDRSLQSPSVTVNETLPTPDISINCEDSSLCADYRLRLISPVSGITPFVMQRRLALSGIRPIQLAVDITNYVLLELGQPLHAFDSEKVGAQVTIGFATDGDAIQLLNQEVKPLSPATPIVRDPDGILAVAGVMGGIESAVGVETQSILLEGAWFDSTAIRRAQTQLGIRTESGARFEKGIDIETISVAFDRAAYLFQTLAGAAVSRVVRFEASSHALRHNTMLEWNPGQINRLLGTEYSVAEMENALRRLGFVCNELGVQVPSWRRHDISEWPCLAEEIARLYGYDPIPSDLSSRMVPQSSHSRLRQIAQVTDSYFIENGFQQVQTYTMVGPDDFRATRVPLPSEWLHIKNPLTSSESVLRRYVMTSLLKVVRHNTKRQLNDIQIFEVGKVFYVDRLGNIQENLVAGAIVVGSRWWRPFSANEKATSAAHFLHLKGTVEELFNRYQVGMPKPARSTYPQYHPTLSADLTLGDQLVGNVGFLHPDMLSDYDLDVPVGYIGLNLTMIASMQVHVQQYVPHSRYPSSRRDIAFLSPKSLGFDAVSVAIDGARSTLLVDYFLFDHFESEKLGSDVQSLAIAFVYQAPDRTLSDEDVSAAHTALVDHLSTMLPITIR